MPPSCLLSSSALRCRAFVAAGSLCLCAAVHADPADSVFVPYGEEGVRIVQIEAGHEAQRAGGSEDAYTLALGAHPTARWSTAVYAGWYREPQDSTRLDAYSWLNHWDLVGRDDAVPADIGWYLEIERPQERDEGYELTWGPTFQFDTRSVAITANTWLQKSVHASDAEPTALVYQWQAKSLWRAHLELGVQGFGDLGPWRHWEAANAQEHEVGPALWGRWPAADGRSWLMDTALLAGVTSASPRLTWRLRGQYRF